MKEKKNIDELFQDGFKNFEATPSPRVWENIQTELNRGKKKRKVIPLWIRIGSVAALFALLLTVGNLYFSDSKEDGNLITNEEINPSDSTENNTQHKMAPESADSKLASENEILEDQDSQDQNPYTNTNSKNRRESKSSDKGIVNISKKSATRAVAATNSEKSTFTDKNDSKDKFTHKDNKRLVTEETMASSKINSPKKENVEIHENTMVKEKDIFNKQSDEAVVKAKTGDDGIDKNKEKAATDIASENKNKKSIFEAIAEKDEKKNNKEKPEPRWNVTPNIAPVYYSSFGSGSSIDPSFTNNPQKGDVNMSYGVQVSYDLNKRLSLRTGINNVDLSYSTSDIVVGTGPVAVALRSVDYGSNQIVVTAIDKTTFESAASTNDFDEITTKSTVGDARLIQNLSYYEIPLELKYAVIDRKLGVNLIGGISTLFLGNNEISVKADNFNSVLGEANNLSSVSFSTNVGLGLDYKLSRKFTFNIEPMFKYQLNPYTDSSVNFKPYYLGVYSGLSFKF